VALQSQTKEKNELLDQKKEKDQVVSKLKSQSNDLKKEIALKRRETVISTMPLQRSYGGK
jgi:hypothetical protein